MDETETITQYGLFRDEKAPIYPKKRYNQLVSQLRKLHEELNRTLYNYPSERPSIHAPTDAVDIVYPLMAALDHEELYVILLDTRNRVMQIVKLYVGSLNSSNVRVGEVYRAAIIENSASIIVVHNHPSGDPSPSPDDVAVTRAMREAGKILDIELLDSLIIGRPNDDDTRARWVSLKERGLGF